MTFVVGGYNIDEGINESQDFTETLALLKAYAEKRVGPGKYGAKPQSGEDLFGANEAYDVSKSPWTAQPSKTSCWCSWRVRQDGCGRHRRHQPEGRAVRRRAPDGLALPWITIAKMVSDKAK